MTPDLTITDLPPITDAELVTMGVNAVSYLREQVIERDATIAALLRELGQARRALREADGTIEYLTQQVTA